MKLGERIKGLRKRREMTLDELSRISGVAKGTLSKMENDLTTGTLRTVMRVSEALDLDVSDLYRGIEKLSRETSVLETQPENTEIFTYDDKISSTILVKQAIKKRMLPALVALGPNSKTTPEQDAPGTEKFIFCLEGNIEVKVGENTYLLKKGGSVYFKSTLSYSFRNAKPKPAKFISVTSPPTL